jgi:hypothetical protein
MVFFPIRGLLGAPLGILRRLGGRSRWFGIFYDFVIIPLNLAISLL